MDVLTQYYTELDRMQDEYRTKALTALEKGAEREHSVLMMQCSMCGDMLRNVGRVVYQKLREDFPQKLYADLEKERSHYLAKEDYDMADRAQVKGDMVRSAMAILERLCEKNA